MANTYTAFFKFAKPADGDTDWGPEYREELADALDMILEQIARGNGILSPAASTSILSAGTGALQITSAAVKVVINETLREVAAQTDQALTDADINYIYIDSAGSFTISTTIPSGEFCLLGIVKCEAGARTYIANAAIRSSTRVLMINSDFLIMNADRGTDGTAADGGIKVERGATGVDAEIRWNETDDAWEAGVVGTVYQVALLKGASNTLRHDEGGLEADVSAYDGIPLITGGVTTALTQGAWHPGNILSGGGFESWSGGTAVPPDGWAISGAGASVAREGTIKKVGTYSAAFTRAGTNCNLYRQLTSLAASYQGRTLTLGGWVYATVASRAQFRLSDGVAPVYSSYHSGGSSWEWLTAQVTFDAAASDVRIDCYISGGDTTAYFDGIIVMEGAYCPAFYPHPNDEHLKAVHHTVCTQGSEVDASYGLVRAEVYEIIEDDATVAITFQDSFTKLLGWSIGDEAAANAPFISGESGSGCTVNMTDVGTNYMRAIFWGVD